MTLYVLRDRATLAAIAAEPPACDGLLLRFGQADDVLASVVDDNPLQETWLYDRDLPGSKVLSWSGSLGEALFDAHPATWLRPGHEALARFCDEVAPQLEEAGTRLCFRPHARHVLSDPQSCLNFLRERAGQPFEIALSPAGFLEESMLDRVEDHMARAFEALGPCATMVLLHDVRVGSEENALQSVPLGQGALPRDLVQQLLKAHLPTSTPIVLTEGGSLEEQRTWLGERT